MAQNEMEDKSVLVTGATGFIGGHLVNALLEKGYSVTCLVRSSSNLSSLEKLPVRLIFGSIENPDSIRTEAEGIKTVYHIAGLTKARNRKQFYRINQTGTLRLLEILARSQSPPGRFVFASSLAAAGPSHPNRPLTEDDEPNPVSWYGESKLAAEKEALKYSSAFPVTILRPPAVYGPGDRDIYLIFRMIKSGFLFMPGGSPRQFNMIHVHDLIDAFIKAGESDTPSGEVFFISRPEIHTWEAVGREIAKEMGTRYRKVPFPQCLAMAAGMAGNIYSRLSGKAVALSTQKVRELLQPSWTCNASKAKSVLGFSSAIDLHKGIRNTVQWYRQHDWL